MLKNLPCLGVGSADLVGRKRITILTHLSRVRVFVFIGIACLFQFPVILHPYTRITGGIPDAYQYVWYIGWFWHAVSHGLNPLFTQEINWPYGVGLMYNTSIVSLSFMFGWLVPLTSAVFVYNFVFFINIVSVGYVGQRILEELGIGPMLSLWGGVMFCFMPYLTAQDLGHMSQFAVVPLMLVLLMAIRFVSGRSSMNISHGLIIGLTLAFEFYTSLELLTTLVMVSSMFILILIGQAESRLILSKIMTKVKRSFLRASFLGFIIPVIPGIISFTATGGMHISKGGLHPGASKVFGSDLFSPIIPSSLIFAHSRLTDFIMQHLSGGGAEEQGSYVGIVLIIGILVLRQYWRSTLSRSLLVLAASIFVLSMGSYLHVYGHQLPLPMPWILLGHTPLIDSALPIRLSLYTDIVLIIWFAKALKEYGARTKGKRKWAVCISLLAVVSWFPNLNVPYSSAYFLPKRITNVIADSPIVWVTPNFGYDMQPLASDNYEIVTFDLYGFGKGNLLTPPGSAVGLSYMQWSQTEGVRYWMKQLLKLRSQISSGYLMLTPFNPQESSLPNGFMQAAQAVLGQPQYSIQGCELWKI